MKQMYGMIRRVRYFVIISILTCGMNSLYAQSDTVAGEEFDYYSMDLEALMNVEVESASLTDVKNNLTPVPAVTITKEDIELSGARSLDELLEIFVPSFTLMYKGKTTHSIGIRGVISDRNNKVLLLVNGKTMNDRSLVGASSERMLSMLGDIERIEVIQSPQSSLYGPGAISSVINIYTKSGKTKGPANEVEVNQGIVDYFTSAQVRHSNKINDDLSYSVYFGADKATGASQEDSPVKLGFDANHKEGDTIIADEAITFPVPNLNSSNEEEMRYKAHAQIDYKDWSTWVRYTKGGMDYQGVQQDLVNQKEDVMDTSYYKYTHLTAFTNYKNNWDAIGVDFRVGYDVLNAETRHRTGTAPMTNYKENEIYSRLLFSYNTDKFGIAAGPAVSVETFGMPAFDVEDSLWRIDGGIRGLLYDESKTDSANAYAESWSTTMLSGIAEASYLVMDNLSVVAGARVDKHDYTGVMISPRASIIYKPTDKYLVRAQYSRSNRRADDVDLRKQYLRFEGDTLGDVEVIDFYELSSDLRVTDQIALQPSVYYSDYDIVSWTGKVSEAMGNLKYWGVEIGGVYRSDKLYARLSHNYINPTEFTLEKGPEEQKNNNVSTMPYGYGESLHNYPDHITKMVLQYKLNEKMAIHSSLQVQWGLEGAQDENDYQADVLAEKRETKPAQKPAWTQVYTVDGADEAYKPTAYLHLGYIYNITEHFKASLHGYNLLGLVNENLNKRSEFQRNSMYRIQPVSGAIKLAYKL